MRCNKIIFVIDGEIELKVFNTDRTESCQLDLLKSGDTLGQFSILKQKGFLINGQALVDTRVYYLDLEFFNEFKSKIDGLESAMQLGKELMQEEGVPIEDYTIHQYNKMRNRKYMMSKQYNLKQKIRQRFLNEIKQKIKKVETTN